MSNLLSVLVVSYIAIFVGIAVLTLAGKYAFVVVGSILGGLYIIGSLHWYFITSKKEAKKSADDYKQALIVLDKGKKFTKQINMIVDAMRSYDIKREFFDTVADNESITKAVDLIHQKIVHNYESAKTFLKYYDWKLKPASPYFDKLAESSKLMSVKLSELTELISEVQDSTSDVDISYVVDFTSSLSSMIEDDNRELENITKEG